MQHLHPSTNRTLVPRLLFAASLLWIVSAAACAPTEIEFQQTISYKGTLDVGRAFGDFETPTARQDLVQPVSFAVTIDLTASGEGGETPPIAEYKDNPEKLTELRFSQLTFNVLENTVTAPLGPMEVAFGPTTLSHPDDGGAVLMGSVPKIEALSTPSGSGQLFHQNTVLADNLINELIFGLSHGTQMAVSAGDPIPSGRMRIEGDIVLIIVGDAL